MPFDIYSTRAMLAAIELQPREYSFLYDTFVKELPPVEDSKAIYDFKKGQRQMAPFVTEGTGGVVMGRTGYETREIGFCTIAPERVVTNADIGTRAFGENIIGGMRPDERAKRLQAKDLLEMRQAIQLRREWMARQVLLTGKLDIFRYTNEGRDMKTTLVADYGFTNQYAPEDTWDSQDAHIERDMQNMFDLVYEGLGYVDMLVMDPASATAMMENSKYIKQFDGKNIDMGTINTRYKGQGIRFIGWNSDGVEMYSMSGTFLDDDGVVKPVLPKGTVIAGSKGMLKGLHGPVTQVEDPSNNANFITYIKKEVPLRYASLETSTIKNRVTSCPTIVPFNVDAWAVATVL